MKFRKLAKYFKRLEETASRLEMTEILAEVLKEASSDEVDKIVYLSLGSLGPSYENKVFNLAEKMVVRIVAEVMKKQRNEIEKQWKSLGDLGGVIYKIKMQKAKSKGASKGSKLTVKEVYQQLKEVAEDAGGGSQDRKVKEAAELLKGLSSLGAKYVVRILVGKLRLGFSEKTILDGLSFLRRGDKSGKSEIEKAYFVMPDAGRLAKMVKKFGIKKSSQMVKPHVGVPVLPMLAQRLKTAKEMIDKMGRIAIEPKLDGLRLLIHIKKGRKGLVKAFTRNLNETSWMFPELKEIAGRIKARKVIIDVEAVGVDESLKKMANFQKTMTRRRKHEIDEASNSVSIKFWVFDILYKDGKNLMDKAYKERRRELVRTIKSGKYLEVVDSVETKDAKLIKEANIRKRQEGLEGIIVKKLNGRYVPGRTGWRWVKMKEAEDSVGKLSDTVDAVVMGYTRGKGRRAQFGVGQFLAGVRKREKVYSISKVGTGLTDEQFKDLEKRLKKLILKDKPKEYIVDKLHKPDFWVEPKLVVELAADDITKSPSHTGGLALRFPRLVRFRDDKDLSQVTTIKEVKNLFKMQLTNI